ncbi:MAG: DUF6328 family protein [Actinomycetes bacterium]
MSRPRDGGQTAPPRRGKVEPDADPLDGRQETEDERMDRNWIEILQELRVVQTGTQILTGFLLTIAFQPKFDDLDRYQRTVYLVLVVTAALTTALALAPVNLHRGLFRRHRKALLVRVAHLILQGALVAVAVVLVGTVLLIFDVTVGREAGLVGAAALAVVVLVLAVLPVLLRSSRPARGR